MRKEAIGQGATVDIALENARKELGVDATEVEVEIEVLETGSPKLFGVFGGKPAKVRVYIETDEPEEKPAPKAEKPAAKAPEKSAPATPAAEPKAEKRAQAVTDDNGAAEKAAAYLKEVLRNIGIGEITVDIEREENGANLTLSGEEIGFIIGHRGETLDALQYLASLVANHVDESYYRITLDVGNYREKRKETLEALGRRMAIRAVKTGRNSSLEPMNPYERRIIHTAVQAIEGAKSWSEGEDLARHVVIGPEGGERYHRGGKGRGDRRDGGRRGSRPPRRDGPRPDNSPRVEGPKSDDPAAPVYGRIEVNK